jgi:dTDP-4-amino-4,6-dideoxy-D-galactose acyltransferase
MTSPDSLYIDSLPWDSEAFGFSVARIGTLDDPQAQLPIARSQLVAGSIKLAYWQAPFGDPESRCAAAENFGDLINSRVELIVDIAGYSQEAPQFISLQHPDAIQRAQLDALALASGWSSHFALDPKFPDSLFEKLYFAWLEKSLNGEIADEVLVSRTGDTIKAMVTVSARSAVGSIGLFSVAESARGKGIGKKLLHDSLVWFALQGCSAASVVTQGENEGALALYRSCGFKVKEHLDIYHFWNNAS